MEYKALNILLREILDVIKGSISSDLFESNMEYISVGEPGIAFENICSYIDDHDISISQQTFEKIKIAGQAMEMNPSQWSFVERHVNR